MGWAFRQTAHAGGAWRGIGKKRFASFEHHPAAAASLGQVHRARARMTAPSSPASSSMRTCNRPSKPIFASLGLLFAIRRRFDPAIDTTEMIKEIGARNARGAGLSPRSQARRALPRHAGGRRVGSRCPMCGPSFQPARLLALDWLEGSRMLEHKDDALAVRNRLAKAMFTAWWVPFSRFGVIHGDPHLGNYSVFTEKGKPAGINLLDYGCIRIFPPKFVGGVVDLYNGLRKQRPRPRRARLRDLGLQEALQGADRHPQHLGALHLRAADGRPCPQHRRWPSSLATTAAARRSRCTRRLRERGPVTVPREFVLMDRAAIGLGGVFLHLRAELNFHRLFEAAIRQLLDQGLWPSGRRRRSRLWTSRRTA